jgi:hypothetical protein
VSAPSRPGRRRQALFLVLLVGLAWAAAGCSMTTNNGNCDAQGGNNAVSCAAAPASAPSASALAGSSGPASSASLAASPASAGSSAGPPSGPPPALKTYKNVLLEPLCDSGQCNGTQEVANTVFSYTDEAQALDYPQYNEQEAFQGAQTSCRELTIRFSGDDWAQEQGNMTVDYLKFVQQSAATVYAQVDSGQIATVHVSLDGGPLYIDASVANAPGIHNNYVLLDVMGTCSTPDGIR